MKFCFQNLENGREDKNECRWTTFGDENEESSILVKSIGNFFFIIKTKNNLSASVLYSQHFFKFWKQNCMYCGHKRVET